MTATWSLLLLAALASGGRVPGEDPTAPSPDASVRQALESQDYPWYDADRDAVRPVLSEPGSWSHRLGKWIGSLLDRLSRMFRWGGGSSPRGNPSGQAFFTLLMLAGGALFVLLLWRLWRLHDIGLGTGGEGEGSVGDAARIAGLRPGRSLEGVDPWAEAHRLRVSDPAGAIIWLFLDQLLSLQRAGLIRLVPGRTARQYVQSLEDPVIADSVRTTLGAFEDVYYGHRQPSAATLSSVWARAEQFRARLDAIRGER